MPPVNNLRFQTNPYSNIQYTPAEQLSHSDTESPSRSASKVLFSELETLCAILRDLETKIEERLAPILHPIPEDAAEPVCYPPSGFTPLFHELFLGLRAAQDIAVRNHDLIDRVDTL